MTKPVRNKLQSDVKKGKHKEEIPQKADSLNLPIDKLARTIAICGLIISVFGTVYGVINNNLNREIQRDQFYLNNVPPVTITKVIVGKSFIDSTDLMFTFRMFNNSTQVISSIYQTAGLIDDRRTVLRDVSYNNGKVHLYTSPDKIIQNLKPYDTLNFSLPYDFKEFDTLNKSPIMHFYFLMKSDKDIYFDKYVFVQLNMRDSAVLNKDVIFILDTLSKNVATIGPLMRDVVLFDLNTFTYDSKVYLTKEREKILDTLKNSKVDH